MEQCAPCSSASTVNLQETNIGSEGRPLVLTRLASSKMFQRHIWDPCNIYNIAPGDID